MNDANNKTCDNALTPERQAEISAMNVDATDDIQECNNSISRDLANLATNDPKLDHNGLAPMKDIEEAKRETNDRSEGAKRRSSQKQRVRDKCVTYFKEHMAYELISQSGKVVVFDSELGVLHALDGLLLHDINCAPVWDSRRQKYVGMLSVTDFIDVLRHTYSDNKNGFCPAKQRICDWQGIKRDRGTSINRLLCISPECTLHEAARLLVLYQIHRLCVVHLALGNTILSILSQHKILKALMQEVNLQRYQLTIREAGIGKIKNLVTVTYETPLIETLNLLVAHGQSALPIVDSNGVLVNYYSRSDTRFLAMDKTYNCLDITLKEALSNHKNGWSLPTCKMDDNISYLCQQLLHSRMYCIACVREDNTIEAIIELKDIYAFLLGINAKQDVKRKGQDSQMFSNHPNKENAQSTTQNIVSGSTTTTTTTTKATKDSTASMATIATADTADAITTGGL